MIDCDGRMPSFRCQLHLQNEAKDYVPTARLPPNEEARVTTVVGGASTSTNPPPGVPATTKFSPRKWVMSRSSNRPQTVIVSRFSPAPVRVRTNKNRLPCYDNTVCRANLRSNSIVSRHEESGDCDVGSLKLSSLKLFGVADIAATDTQCNQIIEKLMGESRRYGKA